ncbi:MAG: hypothetical protein PHI27_02135 [Eubacteriales bacterium]|nr:hypothetical protein [Eubacteriales bacterium]MDD3881032.1 hypothetical protein [Eubacteriales bacterium]MDD4511899.1 hypothetical protein [Eubacteriales bacterium]
MRHVTRRLCKSIESLTASIAEDAPFDNKALLRALCPEWFFLLSGRETAAICGNLLAKD